MPGGRLTQQHRQLITEGLAGGLGYAEIARQLGRPTSTISREVARNGGPQGYRAEPAHQATQRRAHRGPRTPPPRPPAEGRDPSEVRDFLEQFTALMVHTGIPRMAARVFARLVTTDSGRLTAAELVDQLQVSPASVSKAIGFLEPMDLVRRERDPRRSRDVYVIDDDVWLRTWLTSARTNAMWAEAAERGVEVFDATTPAGARLDQMSQFFTQLSADMSGGPSVLEDALTVLAALLHADVLSPDQLATALDWSPARLADAVREAGPDRLTAEQREIVATFVLASRR